MKKFATWTTVLIILLALPLYFLWWRPQRAAIDQSRSLDRLAAQKASSSDLMAAEDGYLAAIAARPGDTAAYSALGDLYKKVGDPDLAIIAFQKLLRISPHFPHVYCRMALAADDLGSDRQAAGYAEQEIQLDPKCTRALTFLARLNDSAGDHEKARAFARRAYEAAPTDEEAVTTYVQRIMDGDPDKALDILTRAQPSLPDSAELYYELGWCCARAVGPEASQERAIQYLRKAVQLNPADGDAHQELSRILLDQGNITDAVKEGALAVRWAPTEEQSYLVYGHALERAGRKAEGDRALSTGQQIVDLKLKQSKLEESYVHHVGDPSIAHDLAALDERVGLLHNARVVLSYAQQAHPNDPQITADISRLNVLERGRGGE